MTKSYVQEIDLFPTDCISRTGSRLDECSDSCNDTTILQLPHHHGTNLLCIGNPCFGETQQLAGIRRHRYVNLSRWIPRYRECGFSIHQPRLSGIFFSQINHSPLSGSVLALPASSSAKSTAHRCRNQSSPHIRRTGKHLGFTTGSQLQHSRTD
jgi:hypothetical protein